MRETPTSRMLSRYRKPEPAWMEPARIGSTVIWAFALTLHTFYQNYGLSLLQELDKDSFYRIGGMLGILTPLWYASYFNSLALALAIYLASLLFRTRQETLLTIGLHRSGRTQIVATLCLAVCSYILYVRLAPVFPMIGCCIEHLQSLILSFHYGVDHGRYRFDQTEAFAWIGLLATLTVLVRGWGLLPLLGIARRNFLWTGIVLAVSGTLFPFAVLPGILPVAGRVAVDRLSLESPEMKGLIFVEEEFLPDARLFLASYLETHNDDGLVISQSDVNRNQMPSRVQFQDWDRSPELCELCQIPGLPYWTTNGIPLLLLNESPPTGIPDLVLELPRAGGYCRYYEPVLEAKIFRAPLGNLAEMVDGKTWIILKIDWTIGADQVLDTLRVLRQAGVNRVDLAVLSYGFAPLRDAPIRFDLENRDAGERYRPTKWDDTDRRIIIVRKYTPPPPDFAGPRQQECTSVDRWETAELRRKFVPEKPGSLSGTVSIPVVRGMKYGEFVQYLAGAMAGGADSVDLSYEQEGKP